MAESAALGSVLRLALADPGASVPRKHEAGVTEPLYLWQARAVIAALKGSGFTVVAAAELDRLRAAARAADGDGETLGFTVVTWNQASAQPDIDAPGLDDWDTACLERDDRRAKTAAVGRGERHEVAAVIRLEGGG